jgi:hypothetical protein
MTQVTGGWGARMADDDTRDRVEIYELFNRYADAMTGRQWALLDEVFTEDVTSAWLGSHEVEGRATLVRWIRNAVERASETHVLGNYTATIDGDVAEASVRVRVYQMYLGASGRLHQKILGAFRVKLVRTRKGWRFRHFSPGRYTTSVAHELFAAT